VHDGYAACFNRQKQAVFAKPRNKAPPEARTALPINGLRGFLLRAGTGAANRETGKIQK
jgi:hypothetical protein